MIDPFNITNFNRTHAELEELLLFCVFTANKGATATATKLDWFLKDRYCNRRRGSPLKKLRSLLRAELLEKQLRWARLSPYVKNIAACHQLASLPWYLDEITLEQLTTIHGIGEKTARMYLLYSRPDQRLAVLDVHVLRWMRSRGHSIPKWHPTGNVYRKLEISFLNECKAANKTPVELDREIWTTNAIGSTA
jgi:thermostable 8-oxoguanine DNA glycosylase